MRLPNQSFRLGRVNFRPDLEVLENRLTPAIITPLVASVAGTTGTFTDSDGDVVTVIVRGKAGTATFTDSNDAPGVADGTNIKAIAVTNASADFSLTFLDDAAGPNGVALGTITAQNNRLIRGIYTVDPNGSDSNYQLTSFVGKGLSANGSIVVDTILGDGSGLGVDVASLGAGQSIDVTDDLPADLLIRGNFGGSIKVGGNLFSGDLTIQGKWLKGGEVLHTGVAANWSGVVSVTKTLAGEVLANGDVSGAWNITGAVTASARLQSNSIWSDLNFNNSFSGHLTAAGGVADMDVLKAIGGTARITAGGNTSIFVQKGIAAGASVNIGGPASVLDVDILNGNFGGALNAQNDIDLTLVTGSVTKSATLIAGGNTSVNLASGNFGGAINTAFLDFRLSNGSVTKTAVIQAAIVEDNVIDGDSEGFIVGGSFAGILQVSGTFSSGSGPTAMVIAGKITNTANLTIANLLPGFVTEYVFGNRLEGQLTFLGNLTTNVKVNGSVAGPKAGIKIFGQVVGMANINVVGNLSFLSSFSGFDATTGNFVTADDVITGSLTVGGTRGIVLPEV